MDKPGLAGLLCNIDVVSKALRDQMPPRKQYVHLGFMDC